MQPSQPSPTWQQPPPPYNQDAPSPKRSSGPNIVLIVVLSVIGTLVAIGIIKWVLAVSELKKAVDEVTEFRKAATYDTIASIDQTVTVYYVRTGNMPKGISDLIRPIDDDEQGVLMSKNAYDAWGNLFKLEVDGKKYTIRSAGPDGQMNTEDDITN